MGNSAGFLWKTERLSHCSCKEAIAPAVAEYFAVYTRPNQEKIVAEQLRCKGIDYFLPLYTSVRRWQDRLKTLSLPLFPGYLFARVAPSGMLQVLKTHGVVKLVGSPRPIPLQASEIEQLQRFLSSAGFIEPHPYLQIGQRVRVRRGPLNDVEGILIRKRNQLRLVISVELIQRSVAIEVDAADVIATGKVLPMQADFPAEEIKCYLGGPAIDPSAS